MKKTIKTYEENGIKYQFDAKSLDAQINQRKHYGQKTKRKITKAAIMEELADKLFVSTEAVKNWMYGNNGPSELAQVKSLAEYFKIDYRQLLKREEGQMTDAIQATIINDAQVKYTKERVREIYHAILSYLSKCEYHMVFLGDLTDEYKESGDYTQDVQKAYGDMLGAFHEICDLLEDSLLEYLKTSIISFIIICGRIFTKKRI